MCRPRLKAGFAVAAMQRHELTNLLTFNGPDFGRFSTISVYSPAEMLAGRIPA
jgi:hypothetical protein